MMTKDKFIKLLLNNGWELEDELERLEYGDQIVFLYETEYTIVIDNMENPDNIHICNQEGNNFISFADLDTIVEFLIGQHIIKDER